MNHQIDSATHEQCARAFLAQMIRTIRTCVSQSQPVSAEAQEQLVSSLAFGIAAHLSGSSYGGSVQGEEVYPVLGFSLGESSDAVYFGNGSALHEFVSSVLEVASKKP